MRYLLIILTAFLLFKSDAFAQSDTTTVLKDSVRTVMLIENQNLIPRSLQLMPTYGFMPLPYESLNRVLEKSKYQGDDTFGPDWAGGSFAFGLEMQQIVGDSSSEAGFIAGAAYSETSVRRSAYIRFSRVTADIGASFRVFKNDWFALYPFFLFNPEYNVLTATTGGRNWDANGDFNEYFNEQFYTSSLQSGSFSITPGIGADMKIYTFFENQPLLKPMKMLLGMRASYQIGLFSPQWTDGNSTFLDSRSTLMNGPDVAVSGFRLGLAFGFAVDYQIFKAKIISQEK
jgi:hypothetical protein